MTAKIILTRDGTKRLVRYGIFTLILFVVAGYAVFASHDLISGPSIEIREPKNGSTFTEPRVTIQGVVRRIQDITLNGGAITIDDKGNFKEIALLAPGYNIFTLTAKDRFGRSKEYRLELIYKVD